MQQKEERQKFFYRAKRVLAKVFYEEISLRMRYIVSYIIIAILSCLVISLLMIMISRATLRKTVVTSVQYQMEQTIQGLEAQYAAMVDIGTNIKTKMAFRPFYFKKNKYYETVLLDELSRLRSDSSVYSEYSLLYRDSKSVFRSDGSLSSVENALLTINEDQRVAFRDLIYFAENTSVFVSEDNVYFVFPLHITGRNDSSGDATLFFLVPNANMFALIERMLPVNEKSYVYDIFFNGITIASSGAMSDKLTILLDKTSDNGMFTISFKGNVDRLLRDERDLYSSSALIIGLSMLVLMILAYCIALKQYRPINKLVSQFTILDKRKALNELKVLEHVFRQSMLREEEYLDRIREQMSTIRRQALRMLLAGNISAHFDRRLELAGISLLHPYYRVFVVSADVTESDMNSIASMIENLSDIGNTVYCLAEVDHIAVIINYSRLSNGNSVHDMVLAVLDEYDLDLHLYEGGYSFACDSLYSVQFAYLEALYAMSKEKTESPLERTNDITDFGGYQEETSNRLIQSIEVKNESAAECLLSDWAERLSASGYTPMLEHFLFSDLFARIVNAANRWGIYISDAEISLVMAAHDVNKYSSSLWYAISNLIKRKEAFDERLKNDLPTRILQFVQDRYSCNDMSLEMIAMEFGLSVGYVGKTIKKTVGMAYKEYITMLRMRAAKKMLILENSSVSETSAAVGYANISHFIKVFRESTGITPAMYKAGEREKSIEKSNAQPADPS